MSKRQEEGTNLGFASMDPEKQREIASKGGHVRGQQLHEQAEERRRLEAEGRYAEAEDVKPKVRFKNKVGFAAMDPAKQKEIASKGGQTRGAQMHQEAELRHEREQAQH